MIKLRRSPTGKPTLSVRAKTYFGACIVITTALVTAARPADVRASQGTSPETRTYTADQVTSDEYGDTLYMFRHLPGVTAPVTYTVAREGFNPITASPAELEAAGFPPRPGKDRPKALSQWRKVAAAWKRQSGPVTLHLVVGGARSAVFGDGTLVHSLNWAGYGRQGQMEEADGEWIQPYGQPGDLGCGGLTSGGVIWAGLGGVAGTGPTGTTPHLVQTGTTYAAEGSLNEHQAWWEDVPLTNGPLPMSLFPNWGDKMSASVSLHPIFDRVGPGGAVGPILAGENVLFFDEDLTTGFSVSVWMEDDSTITGLPTAEWIVERPLEVDTSQGQAGYTALDPLERPSGELQWTGTLATDALHSGDVTAGSTDGYHLKMTNASGSVLADPYLTGFSGPSGQQFNVHYYGVC